MCVAASYPSPNDVVFCFSHLFSLLSSVIGTGEYSHHGFWLWHSQRALRSSKASIFVPPRDPSLPPGELLIYWCNQISCFSCVCRNNKVYQVLIFFWLAWNGVDPFSFIYLLWLQGTTVRVEFGDATTTADPSDAPTISRSFPNTYGHPLAHFLRATAKVPDAQIITEFPPIRSISAFTMLMFPRHCCEF